MCRHQVLFQRRRRYRHHQVYRPPPRLVYQQQLRQGIRESMFSIISWCNNQIVFWPLNVIYCSCQSATLKSSHYGRKLPKVNFQRDILSLCCNILTSLWRNKYYINNHWTFLIAYQLQVLCRHRRQYQHHQVCPLHQGNVWLKLLYQSKI